MRKIIHCDADCFFVALEMRDDPSLCGIPVAVGGQPGKRGVISTCNYEARAFGIHSAMASAHAKRLCPQLIILPHNSQKYREASEQMRAIFSSYSEQIEPLSLDEAFVDVSSTHHCLGSATLIAKEMRRRIKKQVGITVSAGVANNKFLAKVASDWQKPDGLTVIEPSRVKFFLKTLPVSCLPGVGKATAKKMTSLGIRTCSDLQALSEASLIGHFGQYGVRLYHLSRGEDDRPVSPRNYRQSLSVEHTVTQDLVELKQCYPLLAELDKKLDTRLHAMEKKQSITKQFIKVKYSDFQSSSIETSSHRRSYGLYKQLLDDLWSKQQQPIRLLGVGVRFQSDLSEDQQQLSLL